MKEYIVKCGYFMEEYLKFLVDSKMVYEIMKVIVMDFLYFLCEFSFLCFNEVLCFFC